MSAIRPLDRELPQYAAIGIQSDKRVERAAKPIFERAQESIVYTWKAAVAFLNVAGDKISFVFFGVIECVYPFLGPKIHNVFLYARLSVQAFWNARTIEEMRTEIKDLEGRVYLLGELREQNERLSLEIQQIKAENRRFSETNQQLMETNEATARRVQSILDQQPNILEREEAVVKERDLVVLKNSQLQKENEDLAVQRNAAGQAMFLALHENQKMQLQLKQMQKEVADLRAQLERKGDFSEIFERIGKKADQIRHIGENSELDADLETILPLLLKQMETARTRLQAAKQDLPPQSTVEVALQSFERIFNEIAKVLERVPKTLKLHGNAQDPINHLLYPQQVEA